MHASNLRLTGTLFVLSLLVSFQAGAATIQHAPIKVVTFNLRYASTNQPNAWSARRPAMRECFRTMAPDVLGTQEGLYEQLKDIASDQPKFGWIGTGRDGGSRGEFMAIFYRKSRLEPLEYDHFWLSETPYQIASTNWGNTNRRMVTWVRFKDLATQRQFYLMNTHLDHAVVLAREKGAALILERAKQLSTNAPVVLIGDFNAEPGKEKTYDILTGESFFKDAWIQSPLRINDGYDTFHDFNGAKPGSFRIDWILTHGPWKAQLAETVIYSRKGQFPSDHHPVAALLQLELLPKTVSEGQR